MKNENIIINKSEVSSHLELNISKQEVNLPINCPYNYQFYFDNIQIVGKDNFEEDYVKIYKKKRNEIKSQNITPITGSPFSTNKTLIYNNNILQNNYIQDDKTKNIKQKNVIENNKDIDYKNGNNDIPFHKNKNKCKKELKNNKKKEFDDEKMQSSCCLIF
jgi:hypothetical protein